MVSISNEFSVNKDKESKVVERVKQDRTPPIKRVLKRVFDKRRYSFNFSKVF
jgi:hypothetical protein